MPVPTDFRDEVLTQLHNAGINIPANDLDAHIDDLYKSNGGAADYLLRKFYNGELKGRAFTREVKKFANDLGISPQELAQQMLDRMSEQQARIQIAKEEAAAAGMTYREYHTRSLAMQAAEIQKRLVDEGKSSA